MRLAARAIIIEGDKLLLMHRSKEGSQYFTLVGGRVQDGETLEQALVREVREETGLQVTAARLVFTEDHPAPYNEQRIFLCQVAPHEDVAMETTSEEGVMNRIGINLHTPVWAYVNSFANVPFRTPQLQQAILQGIKKGFPASPVKL